MTEEQQAAASYLRGMTGCSIGDATTFCAAAEFDTTAGDVGTPLPVPLLRTHSVRMLAVLACNDQQLCDSTSAAMVT